MKYQHFERELAKAYTALHNHELEEAYHHYGRSHVLGQPYAGPHFRTHLGFLKFSIIKKDIREFVGQLIRLSGCAFVSWLGIAPKGNTGGVYVGLNTRMTIPEDLAQMLKEDSLGISEVRSKFDRNYSTKPTPSEDNQAPPPPVIPDPNTSGSDLPGEITE